MGRKGIARHRKRLAAPICYPIPRKHGKFTYRARPSSYPGDISLPRGIVVRDIMKYATTGREAKLILQQGSFLVDGKVKRDPKFAIGPMMVISTHSTLRPVKVCGIIIPGRQIGLLQQWPTAWYFSAPITTTSTLWMPRRERNSGATRQSATSCRHRQSPMASSTSARQAIISMHYRQTTAGSV